MYFLKNVSFITCNFVMTKNRKKKENRRREAENRNKEEENRHKEVDDRYKNFISNKDDASVYSLDEDEMEWTGSIQTSSKKEKNIDDQFTIKIPDMVWMVKKKEIYFFLKFFFR